MMTFGEKLRELRKKKGFTLRDLAEATGLDFTYLSKMENDKPGYVPSADTIRNLSAALEADSLELLRLADKVPPELQGMTSSVHGRRFFKRAQEIASPDDWDALLEVLEKRQAQRHGKGKEGD